jgi:hypothetical protein
MSRARDDERLRRMRGSWADLEPTAFDVELAYRRSARSGRRLPIGEIVAFGLLGAALGAAAALSVDLPARRGVSVAPEPIVAEQPAIATPTTTSAAPVEAPEPAPIRAAPTRPTREPARPPPQPASPPTARAEPDPSLGSARRWLSLEHRGDGGPITVGLDRNP